MSAVKRSAEEITSTSVSKVLKLDDTLEIPEDLELSMWNLDKEGTVKWQLIYDTLYENFFLSLTKCEGRSEKKLMLDIACANKLSSQMEKIMPRAGRMSPSALIWERRSGRP